MTTQQIDWNAVYHVEGGWVRVWLARRVRQDDVEDILHQVFYKAFRYKHTYNPALGKMTTWLTAIACRELSAFRDRESKRPRFTQGSAALGIAKAASLNHTDMREPMPVKCQPKPKPKQFKSARYERFCRIIPLGACREGAAK